VLISVYQLVPGALLPAAGSIRPPVPASVPGWPSSSVSLDDVNSLSSYIASIHAAMPYSLPAALPDTSAEGNYVLESCCLLFGKKTVFWTQLLQAKIIAGHFR